MDYRDPEVMRTHGYHWFDLARMEYMPHPSPIRNRPLLYNLFDTRTEGLATGWEEMMLQAGMFDARPRSRELIYVLLGTIMEELSMVLLTIPVFFPIVTGLGFAFATTSSEAALIASRANTFGSAPPVWSPASQAACRFSTAHR